MTCRIRAVARNESGVVLIEFAMVAPFLILLFLGGFNLASGMVLARKAATAAHAIADLSAQPTIVSRGSLDEIISVKEAIAAPMQLNATLSRVTQVRTNDGGQGKVIWSYAKEGTALVANRPYNLPTDFQLANVTYVITDLEYEYRYQGNFVGMVPMPLSEHVIVLPRQSQDITCADC